MCKYLKKVTTLAVLVDTQKIFYSKTNKMKLNITLLFICCMINTDIAFAFSISKPAKENAVIANVSNNIKASEFVKLSAKDVSIITGKKMNVWNRLSFSVLKMRMRHDLKKNPNFTIRDYYAKKSSQRMSAWAWIGIGAGILLIILAIAGLSLAGVE